jgi:hypothetical protein
VGTVMNLWVPQDAGKFLSVIAAQLAAPEEGLSFMNLVNHYAEERPYGSVSITIQRPCISY